MRELLIDPCIFFTGIFLLKFLTWIPDQVRNDNVHLPPPPTPPRAGGENDDSSPYEAEAGRGYASSFSFLNLHVLELQRIVFFAPYTNKLLHCGHFSPVGLLQYAFLHSGYWSHA